MQATVLFLLHLCDSLLVATEGLCLSTTAATTLRLLLQLLLEFSEFTFDVVVSASSSFLLLLLLILFC